MKIFAIWMFFAFFSVNIAVVRAADSIEAAEDFRKSVAAADQLMVYEGLPHQSLERELLQRETKRSDVTKIAEFSFYTPATSATNVRLKEVLADSMSIAEWRDSGGLCCVFHPDYCVSWTSDGKTYAALICFGCHEVIFVEGKRRFHYSLVGKAYESLKRDLAEYASKRPSPEKVTPGKF